MVIFLVIENVCHLGDTRGARGGETDSVLAKIRNESISLEGFFSMNIIYTQ